MFLDGHFYEAIYDPYYMDQIAYIDFQPEWTFKNLAKLSSRIFSSNPRTGFDNSWLSFIGWPNNRWFGDTYRRYRIWQIWNFWPILWKAKILAYYGNSSSFHQFRIHIYATARSQSRNQSMVISPYGKSLSLKDRSLLLSRFNLIQGLSPSSRRLRPFTFDGPSTFYLQAVIFYSRLPP